MSIVDPLNCGFGKVAVYNILSSKLNLDVVDGEKHNEYRARLLKTKNDEYTTYFCNIPSFNVEYRQFTCNFPKITDNIKSLEKMYKDVKKEILETFSKTVWSDLSFEDKCTHSLMHCDDCTKKTNYRKVLAKFPIRDKKLQQKAAKSGLYRDGVLADITNTLVKTLNKSFKNIFNETFTSQLKPNSKQIREVVRGTAKAFKEDIENKWDERVVET